MRRLLSVLVLSLAATSALAQDAALKNGSGFAEFMMLRLQNELPERWELAARGGLCLTEPRDILLRGAQSLRAQPTAVIFVSPDDYARGLQMGGVAVSPLYPIQIRNGGLFINRWVSAFWTEERTALDALTEGHLLRLGVGAEMREKVRSCVGASGVAKYVTATLKAYRQPTLGLLATQQGQLIATDAWNAFAIPLALNCATEPFTDNRPVSLLTRDGQLRWSILLRLAPDCAQRMNGSAVLVTLDYRFIDGTYADFMVGDPRVRLKFQNATTQTVR